MLVGLAPAGPAGDAAGISDDCLGRDLALNVAALAGRLSQLSLAGEPAADEYPSGVLDCIDPPSSVVALATGEATASHNCVGVMVTTSSTTSGRVRAAEADAAAARTGTSDPLAATLRGLSTPIATTADPAAARAELEAARRLILDNATALAAERRRMEAA
jgi:hypothetical protein